MVARLLRLPDVSNRPRSGFDSATAYAVVTRMHNSGMFLRWSLTITVIADLRQRDVSRLATNRFYLLLRIRLINCSLCAKNCLKIARERLTMLPNGLPHKSLVI